MEEKKVTKISLGTAFLIIGIILGIIVGYYIYKVNAKNANKNSQIKTAVINTVNVVDVNQSKI